MGVLRESSGFERGFSCVKAPSNEDCYLSFGNPAVRNCSCLISDFSLPTSDRFAFSRKGLLNKSV
jgi:hypothetical protein